MPQHQAWQQPQNVKRTLPTDNLDRQALAVELIQHRKQLQGPAFAAPLEHEILLPHVVAILRSESDTSPVFEPQPTALRMSGGHHQPLLTLYPLHALVVQAPAVSAEQGRDPPGSHSGRMRWPEKQFYAARTASSPATLGVYG